MESVGRPKMAAAGIILLMTLFLLTNRDDIHTHTQEHAKTVTKEEEKKKNNKPRVWKRLFGISHGNLNFLLLYMHLIALRRAFGCFS